MFLNHSHPHPLRVISSVWSVVQMSVHQDDSPARVNSHEKKKLKQQIQQQKKQNDNKNIFLKNIFKIVLIIKIMIKERL